MTIIINGFLSTLLVTYGYGSYTTTPLPSFTDPDLARQLTDVAVDPTVFMTDPDAARLI